jgi:hypothetical protein
MRWGLSLLLGLMFASGAQAQSADKKPLTPQQYRQMMDEMSYWARDSKRYQRIHGRAMELAPGRRDTPLRDLNITDGEVREVQTIAARYLPKTLVNISPVVGECPCEEGPACSAQVYVIATENDQTSGLQLSRMKESWDVGVVQRWWLKYSAIRRQKTGSTFLDDYLAQKARHEMLDQFPQCAGQVMTNIEGKTEEKK